MADFTGLSFAPASRPEEAVVPYTDHVTSPAVVPWGGATASGRIAAPPACEVATFVATSATIASGSH